MGGRRARRAPARQRTPDRARAHRAAVRPGDLPRDRRAGRERRLRRRRRARVFLPANMVVGTGRIEGRRASCRATTSPCAAAPRTPPSGRRWSDAERAGARAAAAARAAGRRHGRRRQRQVARADGLHLRAAPPGLELVGREPRAGAGRRGRARAGRRARRRARRGVALLGDRARHARSCSWPGPPVVAAAMGESPDKEELGGARAQTRAGAVDNEAADEDDALAQLKRFLSYLPANVWEAPPIARLERPAPTAARRSCCRSSRATRASPTRCATSSRRSSTAARCSSSARATGGSLITALARLDGRPGRRARLRPEALRRRADRRRVGEARPLRRPLRPVPPAGRQLRRPARAS